LFVAYDENGIIVNVAEKKWSKDGLLKLRDRTNFICPTCSNELELKIGTVITAHFAHKKFTSCTMNSESESQYHLKGKLDLYEWLQNQSKLDDVQLEPYLSGIKQRPDILFRNGKEKIPIEFQCSPIDSRILIKRSLKYDEKDLKVLWLLGAKSIKRTGAMSFQLSSFQWLFARMSKRSDPPYIYSYCSDLKSFIILHTIIPFSPRSAFANHLKIPIHSINYHELITHHPSKKKFISAWIDKIRRFRLNSTAYKARDASSLNMFLYQTKQIPLAYLPSLAFLPLNSSYLIESPVYVWQGWILIFIDHLPLNGSFTFHNIYHNMAKKIAEGAIVIRSLPSIEVHYSYAIKDYLLKLCHYSIIKQAQKNQFIKQQTIVWTTRLEELLMADADLKNKFN
jgi:competence CoiA-like predicted nuclease